MSTRKRLSPEESRQAALEAARQQLIEGGPQSVTLKAVAARIGRTHANLLHHFGSAADLQKALAAYLAQTVCDSIAEAFRATRNGSGTPRDVVDLTFDAFGAEGGGPLVMWMLATGHEDALDPVMESICHLIEATVADFQGGSEGRGWNKGAGPLHEVALTTVLMALGDGLIGPQLADSLAVPRIGSRDLAEKLVIDALAKLLNASANQA